jgi:hypothetical protein
MLHSSALIALIYRARYTCAALCRTGGICMSMAELRVVGSYPDPTVSPDTCHLTSALPCAPLLCHM